MEEFKTEAIESIINAFINDSTERDFIDRFEHIKKKIEKVLAEDNPFSRRVNEWYRRAQAGDKGTEKNLQEEISLELARIKGFGGVDQKENIEVRDVSVSPPNVLGLRPDGPIANEHERFLQMLRQEINILSYPPLTRLCTKLAAQGDTERMTAQDIEQISRFQGRSAYYEFERIEHFLQERYIPSFRRLGLRYRYFFTPRQRPSVLSDGLVERMILNEYDIRGCTVHLEPLLSDGPASHSIPDGTIEAVVEEEIVSMRMDMYDTKNNTWAPEVSSESQKRTDKRANHIEWATDECDNIPFSLTERQVELLGILWRFEGARGQRKWLINQIGYPARTANRLLRQMRDARVLKLMYLPAIEFCGLPDALMVVANCYDRRSRDSLADYLCRKLPFARVLFGDSNDVVAHARIPRKQSDIISITIREAMKENSDRSFVGRLRESNTFRMTVLHRIRDANAQTWTDPWSA